MTVDRKRLRELALAAKRFRESWPNERPSDRPLHAEFTDSKHDEIILELLDALDAAEQPAPDDARIPREPTPAMGAAGVKVRADTVQTVWRAMYDAAIQAQERTP